MNELRHLLGAHPEWSSAFEAQDIVVVESLSRRAYGGGLRENADLALCALLLARAARLEHIAMSLDLSDLTSTLATVGLVSADAAQVLRALSDPTLEGDLVERLDVGIPVAPSGPPLVVATVDGRDAFAYWRRLAWTESQIAEHALNSLSIELDDRFSVTVESPESVDLLAPMSRHRLSIVTGGPGTGKTTSLARSLLVLAQHHRAHGTELTVALCAPTAKAAVRLNESIAAEAVQRDASLEGLVIHQQSGSVHRLLGVRPDRDQAPDPIVAELIVVDEASMLEADLLEQLLRRAVGRVVLVGDPHQLASVDVGAVLRDLVEAAEDGPLDPLVTRLRENFRANADLVQTAEAVRRGAPDDFFDAVKASNGTVQIVTNEATPLAEAIERARRVRAAAESGDEAGALSELVRGAVLCATRRGPRSVAWWSSEIERAVADPRDEIGRPYIVTRNESRTAASDERLFNGDVGVVVPGDELGVAFGPIGAMRRRAFSALPEHEPAWALTIHKSQGSEYDDVIVSLPSTPSPILTRELLYTALTRARRSVTIVGARREIEWAITRRVERVSGLNARVRAAALARAK